MDASATSASSSATQLAASAGANPWTSSTIQNALSTLNDSKASVDDQVMAYKAITDLIASHPSQGGAARVAVVTDSGFTAFAALTTQISDQMNQGVTRSNTTTQQLANFNSLSSDDQEIVAKLNPDLGTVANVQANFQTRIQVEQAVQNAIAAGNYNNLEQVTDKKFDGLKSLGSAQSTNAWTTQAQEVLSQLQSTSQPTDKVDLSPQAKALLNPNTPQAADNSSSVALQTLTKAAANASKIVQGTAQKPYSRGFILNQLT